MRYSGQFLDSEMKLLDSNASAMQMHLNCEWGAFTILSPKPKLAFLLKHLGKFSACVEKMAGG